MTENSLLQAANVSRPQRAFLLLFPLYSGIMERQGLSP